MRFQQALLFLLAFVTSIHALALPNPFDSFTSATNELFKRKGGGGGGGKGGSSGGGTRTGTGSGGGDDDGSGSGSGGSTSSSGGRSGTSGSGSDGTSTTSNQGGPTRSGSGVRPVTYGGTGAGTYYGGGATTPYRAGSTSPLGLGAGLLGGAAAAAIFAGPWLNGAYAYNYPDHYTYYNTTDNMNNTLPVECLCAQYSECGCDANNNTQYINSVANNASIAQVSDVNGTETLVINGTLPGTTVASAAAPGLRGGLLETSGWWVVVGGVLYTMWFM